MHALLTPEQYHGMVIVAGLCVVFGSVEVLIRSWFE